MRLELVHHGLPQVTCLHLGLRPKRVQVIDRPLGRHRVCRGNGLRGSRQLLLLRGNFLFGGLLGILAAHGRRLSALLEVHRGGRQAVLVVASTILQIAVNAIIGLGEKYLLHERDASLEEAHRHVEQGVMLFYLIANGLQFANQHDSLQLTRIERGGDRASAAQARGVNMPSRLYLAREDYLCLGGAIGHQFGRESNGVVHLSITCQRHQEGEQQETDMLAVILHLWK